MKLPQAVFLREPAHRAATRTKSQAKYQSELAPPPPPEDEPPDPGGMIEPDEDEDEDEPPGVEPELEDELEDELLE